MFIELGSKLVAVTIVQTSVGQIEVLVCMWNKWKCTVLMQVVSCIIELIYCVHHLVSYTDMWPAIIILDDFRIMQDPFVIKTVLQTW